MEDTIASKSEYFLRQDRLMSRILPNSLVIIPNNRPSIRSNDTKYPYRANSYMLYLSDWQEPNSVLTISNLMRLENLHYMLNQGIPRKRFGKAG